MTEKYKFLDNITSDVAYEAYGKDLKEVFENAAKAVFSIICKIDRVKAEKKEKVEVKADNVSDLMFDWLQNLIAMVDTEEMFFSKFDIKEIDETHLVAECYGEEIKPELGETVVKAVTMYKYKFEKTDDGYKVVVSVDI